jgi:Mrp family chromosome partitioning ATPase
MGSPRGGGRLLISGEAIFYCIGASRLSQSKPMEIDEPLYSNLDCDMSPTKIIRPSVNTSQPRKSVGAIIRPVVRELDNNSVRLDQEHGVPPRHRRNYELDDYVDWLKNKIDRDRLTATAEDVQASRETKSEPKSEPNRTPEIVLVDQNSATEQDILSNRSTLIPPAPRTQLSESSSDSGMSDAELARQISNAIDAARKVTSTTPESSPESGVGFSTKNFRVDSGHTVQEMLADPHAPMEEADVDNPQIATGEAEHFIATVSKAIAAVLTEAPEKEFEQKVRNHFSSELHARSLSILANKKKSRQTVSTEEAPVLATEIEAELVEPAAVAQEILRDAQKEVPTNIAAWDVEDFRWPDLSNQMIVSGGEAMAGLYQAASRMISPQTQRLAISGLQRSAGTTSIAISLARWAAASGKTVLVVDADVSNPTLSQSVGLAPNLSWINAGVQTLPVAEVIVRSQKSNLCVMPLAPLVTRAAWPRFIYDSLSILLDQVQDHFDLILIDVGPATQLMDELSQPELLVDGGILVHDGNDSPKFRKTRTGLQTFGLKKIVVAENRVQQKAANVA